jgi:RNA polymerase sigma-70 factor (ECF subfamily)
VATARPLSAAFSEGVGDGDAKASPRADLEDVLAALVARGRAAWTELSIDDAHFARFLGERASEEELDHVHVEDLWVACACLASATTSRAIAAIDAKHLREVDPSLSKMGLDSDRIAEVKQSLRALLFTGEHPRIGEYRGSGALEAWLRVTAMRTALKMLRKGGRESPASDDAVLEARSSEDDPELQYMKAAYRAAFKAAFQEALDSLDAGEKTLLKQQIVDGLSIDELGGLYRVHRATAARWVASAREKLLMRTRRTFMMNARLSEGECESIMRLVRSQLDVSLHRRLRAS